MSGIIIAFLTVLLLIAISLLFGLFDFVSKCKREVNKLDDKYSKAVLAKEDLERVLQSKNDEIKALEKDLMMKEWITTHYTAYAGALEDILNTRAAYLTEDDANTVRADLNRASTLLKASITIADITKEKEKLEERHALYEKIKPTVIKRPISLMETFK